MSRGRVGRDRLTHGFELDFNGQEATGLGPLNYEARRGMYVHPTYAVTPEREPPGVLDAWMWAREERDKDGVRHGQKENTRWIEGYERVAEMAAEMPGTRLVYVADREADLLTMMARAQALGTPADWPVRAKHNRCLPDGDGDKLWTHTSAGAALGEITFTMPARDEQKSRKVRQQLWERRVSDFARHDGTGRAGKSRSISMSSRMAARSSRCSCTQSIASNGHWPCS